MPGSRDVINTRCGLGNEAAENRKGCTYQMMGKR